MFNAPTYCKGSPCDPCKPKPGPNCVGHTISKQTISGSAQVKYPLAASYADYKAFTGRDPIPCSPAMLIFCPGGGVFSPAIIPGDSSGTWGKPDPSSLPGSVSFTIGPLSYSGIPVNLNPIYTFYNPCDWHVPGEVGGLGSGAMMTFDSLFSGDIVTTSDNNWGIAWPDSITWVSAPLTAPKTSKLGHQLPLIRRFQMI